MPALGLKSNIIGTLIFLLLIAIFFSNIVVIMFWQRGLVEAETRQVRSYLTLWGSMISSKDRGENGVATGELDALCKAADTACIGASFFDMRSMTSTSSSQNDSELARAARIAAYSGKDTVRCSGTSWGVFTFTSSKLIVAVPVTGDVSHSAGVGMAVELLPIYERITGKKHIVFWYMLLNILFLTIAGFFRLHRSIIRPIERLVKVSETYSGLEGQGVFSENKGGEFGQLSMALNGLIFRIEEDRKKLRATVDSLESANKQLIKTQKEMIRAEKSAAIGRLATGLAHEIGNPIGIVQGYLELLSRSDIPEEERRQFTSRAVGELERISRLIHQLLDFSRSSAEKSGLVDIRTLLDDLIEMVSAQQKTASVSFVKNYLLENGEVVADPDGLRQVFLNCLLNAVDAIREKGDSEKAEIVIHCSEYKDQHDKEVVRVTITDNGMGIKKDNLEKIFDPFFTTKEPGKGTGLGLSVSSAIIETAAGRIWVESEYGKGTSLIIELPGVKQVAETIGL
jgi:two-component system, NtrC family, sensor kinase